MDSVMMRYANNTVRQKIVLPTSFCVFFFIVWENPIDGARGERWAATKIQFLLFLPRNAQRMGPHTVDTQPGL